MKNFFFISVICLIFTNNLFSQNFNWIIPYKTYLKMYLVDDGIYRIDRIDFKNAGINTSDIDPRTVNVYNKGIQIPIYFSGEQDGVFDINDYFDFYGRRNYGGLTKTYDQNNQLVYTTDEYYNQYSDTNVYWVEWGVSNGLRFATTNHSTSNLYPSQFFYNKLHFEKDYFYSQGENITSSDLRFLSTEKFKGEGWYWTQLHVDETVSDTFSTPLLYSVTQNATIRIFAYPVNRNTSIFNEHSLQVSVNGNLVNTIYSNDMSRIDTTINFSSSLLSNSSVNNVTIKYVPASGFSAGAMNFDLFGVQYPKIFKFRNSQLSANLGGSDTTSKLFKISGYSSANPINIYDVNNNIRITNYIYNVDILEFTVKSNAKLELINNTITQKPFRIKQKQVPNLVSNLNEADYLLIYHNLFQSQAEQLRAHRESHDNFRSFKVEIEDIYDIFNSGLEDPIAVRNFVKYAYDNWQLPKLGYVCLLGRGSFDPKKNLSTSIYYKNLIPVYGYPPSDGYFANLNIGSFFYYDQIAIGRLPAYSPDEADAMVNKIIAYENNSPAVWWKTFTYITGGGTAGEQYSYQIKSNSEINTNILPPPISGNGHKIYRSDSSGSVTFNYADSIKNDINRGTLFVNFRGHAGSHDWEVGMSDPNTLNNGSKLPIILSLTCFTAENSDPSFRGFGEKFLYLNNKGAVGFVGTTGWSYVQYGDDFGRYILVSIYDSTRRFGDFLKFVGKQMSTDSLSFNVRHTINCYNLLGDPATKLNLPVRPEFDINNSDYKLSNDFPSATEPVTLTLYPKNFGLYADSCKIRFQLIKNSVNYSFKDTVLRGFEKLDFVNYNFKIDSAGNYKVKVILDYDNWYPLENKENNSITINIPVKNITYIPLKPIDNSIISSDSVEFSGLNPNIDLTHNVVKTILQFDTSKSFNSRFARFFVNNNVTGVTTNFKTPIPLLSDNLLYYWRTNAIINNDSSGWSKIQTFIYSNGITYKSKNDSKDDPSSSSITIHKIKGEQFPQSDLSNTQITESGITLYSYPGSLFVRSLGSNAEAASYFSVADKTVYIDGGLNTGLNMLKVSKLSGNILEFKNVRMNVTASNDTVVSFLNTFNPNNYLMLLSASYSPYSVGFTQAAKDVIRQFGSIYCDSITQLGYFHTWSFIGFLGANHSQVAEHYEPCCINPGINSPCTRWAPSTSSMNVTFIKTSGTVSNIIGPAQTWTSFSWEQSLAPNNKIFLDVIGIEKSGQETVLFSNLETNNFVDLSSINASRYHKLNLLAKLNIDTLIGTQSSILNSIKASYFPPSELVLNNNSLKVTSTYKVGDYLKFAFDYYNVGYFDLRGTIINVYKKSINNSNLILTDTVSSDLIVNSMKSHINKFKVPYFRDSMRVYIDINPKGLYNEFYTYNNTVDFSMSSTHAYGRSIVQVFSDGQLIKNGDYVRTKPEIKINISKQNSDIPLLSDTTQVALRLNDRYVPYFIKGNINPLIKALEGDNSKSHTENIITLYYYPTLENGNNKLAVIHKDDENNLDTASYDVIVSNELAVKDLYNYPNPMKTETNFIFNLAGSTTPNAFKLKIYTVSGRLIKEINSQVNIGYNQIPWDGRDNDGDAVANGTYLYKLIAEGDSKIETKIQKLVMLR